MKNKCKKCRYYHKADSEHGSDGCYYTYGCAKTENALRWSRTILSVTALVISIIALVIRLSR